MRGSRGLLGAAGRVCGSAAAGLVLAALLGAGGGLGAQQGPRLQEVDVSLWPEYDRPSVLVMYRMTLAPQTPVPTTVRLRIPADVGAPSAVAEAQPGGNLVNATYERQVDGDWAVLTIQATRPRLQVEYYDPGLDRDGGRRGFEYRWPGMGSVEALEITAQEPVGARDMTVSPEPDRIGEAADGLVYRTLTVSAPAEPLTVRLEYVKDTDALSVESLAPVTPTNPTAPGDPPTSTSTPTADDVPIWIVALVVLAAGGGGLGWWLLSQRWAGAPNVAADASSSARFCTRCGAAASAGDKFCSACGKPLGG